MRFSLINPLWNFANSIYFGCQEPHLPLEYGYSRALLEHAGHEVQLIDAHLEKLSPSDILERLDWFRPHIAVLTTAPTYLFWRCAPPELRVPQELAEKIRDSCGLLVCVGPHASTTPIATLNKLKADLVVLGECEEILPRLGEPWRSVPSICYRDENGTVQIQGSPHSCDMRALPALQWGAGTLALHKHQHHRFEAPALGPGAEMETSRGCPYHCTFCAKDNFRNDFRRRNVDVIAKELDGLIEGGVEYVYFIDEIFLPHRETLEAIAERQIKFGIQTRIDLWTEPMLDLLGRAGCVSIEAGVESITEEGRAALDKKCKLSTDEISERLIFAKKRVPFVQANLLTSVSDDTAAIEKWRSKLLDNGVWANKPVPLFAYPGSPEYTQRWGAPDDLAWERAHEAYLDQFNEFSDIQDSRPSPLVQLERQERQ